MNYDSPAVQALQARISRVTNDSLYRKRLRAEVRAQRLREARERGTHTEEEWQAIVDRYDSRCVRCGCTPDPRPCKDHIKRISEGGSDAADNLQPMCRECNTESRFLPSFNWRAYRDAHGFTEGAR